MAPRRRRRLLRSNSSVLVCVCDGKVGNLVFRFDVKRLFSDDDDDDDESRSRSRSRRRRPREVLPLPPNHVACFRRPLNVPMDLAASPGGDKIVAATTDGHIMVYDATRSQYTDDHDLGCWKPWPILLALSSSRSRSRPLPSSSSSGAAAERRRRRRRDDDMLMLFATELLDFSEPGPYFEALRLTSGGRLQPLPVPPPMLFGDGDEVEVTSYFVAGGRAWLSVWCNGVKGTYSLDMAAPKLGWRHEGSWVLPLEGLAVYAPDMRLLFGFKRGLLRAIDIEARPRPVIRKQWTRATLVPSKDEGYSPEQDYLPLGGLAYLGGGRLCISWSSAYREDGKRMILALTAVELTMTNKGSTPTSTSNGGPPPPPQMLLRKLRSRCYRLPPDNGMATVLPVL